MAAGAAMAVVGWWSGYKLGGVIALFTAEFFQKYWNNKLLAINIFNFRSCGDPNEYWANVCS
jgi:PAT family beta-lactamase induction signal transducer AmpG